MSHFGLMSEKETMKHLVMVKLFRDPSKDPLPVAKAMSMGGRWFGDGAQYVSGCWVRKIGRLGCRSWPPHLESGYVCCHGHARQRHALSILVGSVA